MAASKDIALRLILVADLVNEAEAMVSRLRNAGTAVRPLRPESVDDLTQMLAEQQVDMVLAEYKSIMLPFDQVAKAVMGCGRDVPLLATLDGISDDILNDIQSKGAQAVALQNHPEQFLKSISTEWADLESRRSQRKLETQMRETQRRCDMLIDSSREPIAYIHEGMHIRANQAYLEMFGYESFDDVEGMSLLDLVAPRDVDNFKTLLRSLSKGEDPPPRYELTARDSEGNDFPAVMEFTAAQYQGEACQQVIFRHQASETDPELARELEELRQRDQATGLLNRATFLHQLENAVSEASTQQGQYGLLLVEPDRMQRLIPEFGLDAVDSLLAALAKCLTEAVGNTSDGTQAAIARFSEHRFAVLYAGDHNVTKALAERVRDAFSGHVFEVKDSSASLTVSVGGVQIGEKTSNVAHILGKASDNLQQCATVGGNRYEIFDPGAMDRAEMDRIEAWAVRLRNALDGEGFKLHFQPVISLLGEPGARYETYLRLQAEDGEIVAPQSFMPIAESHGLLTQIDRWVLAHAIEQLGERQRAGKPVSLLVKISQPSLLDESLPAFIINQLAANGAQGSSLLLQVQESKVFINLRAAQEFATAMANQGCRIVLDQFGAGLDSFQLLSHFVPNIIKIDRSFMEELSSNGDNQRRVHEIAQKARDHGIETIAEFVQDAASMTILFSSGVHYVEGDFLAPAVPEMNYDFES